MTDGGLGLREIKKQMTRDAIAEAAFKLVSERGLDTVTVEEIAAEAFVAPRTFSNYFSCKEEAVVAVGVAGSSVLPDAVLERRGEDPLIVCEEVVVASAAQQSDEQLELTASKLRLSHDHPSLRPYLRALYDDVEEQLAASLAARRGTDAGQDLQARLVAAAAVVAIRSAVNTWVLSGQPREQLQRQLSEAFRQLRQGLPDEGPQVSG